MVAKMIEKAEKVEALYFHALQLIVDFDDTFLELAKLLRDLHDNNPEDFKTLAKLPQLGVRKAYYLVGIDRAFRDLKVDPARLKAIGWTKLSIISRVVAKKNCEKWLQRAETHDAENLKALARGEQPIVGVRNVLLRFTPAQFDVFTKALMKHGAIKNGEGFVRKEAALTKALIKLMKTSPA